MSELKPAATLILLRDRASQPPELLMIERSAGMAFAAGALVFPGGRVDDADFAFADRLAHAVAADRDDLAARIAAIRETIEETGVAIGLDPLLRPDELASARAALAAGDSLEAVVRESGRALDPSPLSLFARWQPPEGIKRRYDTRFYVAPAPEDATGVADGGESARLIWNSAQAFLEDADRGDHSLMFPTRANLVRLSQFADHACAREDALCHGHHVVRPRNENRDGETFFVIDKGIGYSLDRLPLRLAPRG